MRTQLPLLPFLALLLLLLSACGGTEVGARDTETGSFDWEACSGGLECGLLTVPVDHRAPDGETLRIEVVRAKARGDERIGVLVVQAGGPGASSADLIGSFFDTGGNAVDTLRDQFDIIGVEPRGIGRSEPEFVCGEPGSGEFQGLLSQLDDRPNDPAEIEAGEAAIQLCVDGMGAAAGHLGTRTLVADIDAVRDALGEDQISFFGHSYGSQVGGWYASIFPSRVRAMVIDGASPPFDTSQDEIGTDAEAEAIRQDLQPVELQLTRMLEACSEDSCPIFNDGDPVAFYLQAIENGDLIDEELNVPGAQVSAVFEPLYREDRWDSFHSALAALDEGNPGPMAEIAEGQYLGRDPSEVSYTGHVLCLDSWALSPEFGREARIEILAEGNSFLREVKAEAAPLLAALENRVEQPSACPFMDALDTPEFGANFDGGGAPILVVANVWDPITPFAASQEVAGLLGGALVEVDFPEHTVFPNEDCVNEIVASALVSGQISQETTNC